MITPQQLAELEKRYTPIKPPPCRVCGAELTLADSGGGHAARYACSSDEASMMKAQGREAYHKALEHYRESQWTESWRGDRDVLALVTAYRELLADGVTETVLRNLRDEIYRDPMALVSTGGSVVMERVLEAIDARLK